MAKRMTIEDLARITKTGFDEQGKHIDEQGKRIDEQGKRIEDLAFSMKQGFEVVNRRFDKQDQKIDMLTHEVAQNGDAVASLINTLNAESAANQSAHQRIEGRLDRIENHLDLELSSVGATP